MRWQFLLLASLIAVAPHYPAAAADRIEKTVGGGPANIFVSPAGKPYRGKPGDSYAVGLWYRDADGDADGRLTAKEFVKDALDHFAVLDTDDDNELGVAEVRRYENEIVPEIQPNLVLAPTAETPVMMPFGGRGGPPPGAGRAGNRVMGPSRAPAGTAGPGSGPHMGLASYTLQGVTHPLLSADADMNRGVSVEEFQAAARRRFASLDQNRDGVLTLAELPATAAQNRFKKP